VIVLEENYKQIFIIVFQNEFRAVMEVTLQLYHFQTKLFLVTSLNLHTQQNLSDIVQCFKASKLFINHDKHVSYHNNTSFL